MFIESGIWSSDKVEEPCSILCLSVFFDNLTKVPHIRRPKSGEIIKLEELGKSEILITYLRSALVVID